MVSGGSDHKQTSIQGKQVLGTCELNQISPTSTQTKIMRTVECELNLLNVHFVGAIELSVFG